jgi:hypothetical protein
MYFNNLHKNNSLTPSKYDNFDTYNLLTDVIPSLIEKERIYYISTVNKYYVSKDGITLEEIFNTSDINSNISSIQALQTTHTTDINDLRYDLNYETSTRINVLNTINNDITTLQLKDEILTQQITKGSKSSPRRYLAT